MKNIAIIVLLQLNVILLLGQNSGGYDKIGKFESGRAKVELNGLYGIIDIDGNGIASPKYEVRQSYKNNHARVSVNKLWGIIDENGKEVIPVKYDKIGPFKDRKAKIVENEKWG